MNTLSSILRLENISKSFSSGTSAFSAITIEVNEGDFLAIMGPSGSGKSTLLNIMGFMDSPTAGYRYFRGQDLTRITDKKASAVRRDHIGFIFQDFVLLKNYSALMNVELGLAYGSTSTKERRKIALEALEIVGVSHRKDAIVQTLSGGESQRVAIARAIVRKPSVLLCDEPTGNLDEENTIKVIELLNGLRHNSSISVVAVTHNPVFKEFVDSVMYMKQSDKSKENGESKLDSTRK